MLRKILKMGAPSLLQPSSEILADEFAGAELLSLIEDLIDTQQHYGGVGIAAPQIGVNKQVVIIEYSQANISRYSDIGDCPRLIMINPRLTPLGASTNTYNEGCLSLPGLRGEVSRPEQIAYEYYDQNGIFHCGKTDGFLARVMQHECDHLAGILYPMRMNDISKLAFIDIE